MSSQAPSTISNLSSIKSGVIVGADESQEWLLPWWWDNYTRENAHPVAFIDFGMSAQAASWCKERGSFHSLEVSIQVAQKEEIAPDTSALWEAMYNGSVWKSREAWFKKPFALLASPFDISLWIDLDCEILGPLDPLFSLTSPVALVREPRHSQERAEENHLLLPGEVLYNSGVIAFQKNAPLIRRWAEKVLTDNHAFWGDQDILSRLIHLDKFSVQELSPLYNWRMTQGVNLAVVIVHWLTASGKNYIRERGGIRKDFEAFYKSLPISID